MMEGYEQDWLLKKFSRNWCRTIFTATVILYLVSLVGCLCFAYLNSMSVVTIVGAFWLGVLIGMSFGFYVQEEPKWNGQALIASLQLIAGASIIGLFHFLSQHNSYGQEYWFYPIGLVGGFIIGTIWHHADPPKPTTDS
jgi:O-antigen/teichoic acid export membrane protein